MNIHDLSEYQLYKLKSIDPTLSSDWYKIIRDIVPKLNRESQNSVYKNILKPRGIRVGLDKKLIYERPDSLRVTIKNIQTNNKDLVSIALHMIKIMDPQIKVHDGIELADKIEAILGHLDNLDINDLIRDQKNRHNIRVAFLYDLAKWVDSITLNIDTGLRNLDAKIVKSYFKEVFIKQQIQGRDFRSWDSSDLSFEELTHLPSFIKQKGRDRKFFIVEGQDYWFLIGTANQIDKNPYSFRRFLHEDRTSKKYIYLTNIVLDKDSIGNPEYLAHASYCMSRLYTLDRGVSDTILKFVNDIQQLYLNYLKPLLREPLKQDGSHPEVLIKERMIKYEKQLSILILQKLPKIIQVTTHDINDQEYLFYHLDQLMKQMSENIQDFRLQPLSMYSDSSEIMTIKLITLRKLISKSRHIFYSEEKGSEEQSEIMNSSQKAIKEKLGETEVSLQQLDALEEDIDSYSHLKEHGSLWQKMKLGKAPEYSSEEVVQMRSSLHDELFISIVRLAKTEKNSIVYAEFECNEVINENYRHYALANGVLGISSLPRVLRLNEDRAKIDVVSIKNVLYEDIFKANQQWHATA